MDLELVANIFFKYYSEKFINHHLRITNIYTGEFSGGHNFMKEPNESVIEKIYKFEIFELKKGIKKFGNYEYENIKYKNEYKEKNENKIHDNNTK